MKKLTVLLVVIVVGMLVTACPKKQSSVKMTVPGGPAIEYGDNANLDIELLEKQIKWGYEFSANNMHDGINAVQENGGRFHTESAAGDVYDLQIGDSSNFLQHGIVFNRSNYLAKVQIFYARNAGDIPKNSISVSPRSKRSLVLRPGTYMIRVTWPSGEIRQGHFRVDSDTFDEEDPFTRVAKKYDFTVSTGAPDTRK